MKKLNPLQAQYIKDCELLETLNLPNDLFDGLYLANAPKKEIKKTRKFVENLNKYKNFI
jgi:hypothetical protein